MGQRKDGEHQTDGFRYRGEDLAIVLPKDNHMVAPLSEFWMGEVTFEKNGRGGRPTSVDAETGMPIRPANMVYVDIGVPITCLKLKKGREIVAFPVAASAPVTTKPDMPAQPTPPRRKEGPHRSVRKDTEHRGRRHDSPRDAAARTGGQTERKPPNKTPPKQKPVEKVPAGEAAVPTGAERFRAKYGDQSPVELLQEAGRKPKKIPATPPVPRETVVAETIAEQLSRASGK